MTGVRQGCLLLPLLIASTIDWVLQQATQGKGTQWVEGGNLSDLDFSDDTAAMAGNTQDLQTLDTEINVSASSRSLTISAKDQERADWDTSISIGYLHPSTRKKQKPDSFDTKCLRKILGIKWMPNEEVRERANKRPVADMICKRRLNRLGHVANFTAPQTRTPSPSVEPSRSKETRTPKDELATDRQGPADCQNRRWSDAISLAAN